MNDLTTGSIGKGLTRFAIPYLCAVFLQTLYGMVDLFVVGLYNTASTTSAVSIGSQVMHMATVVIAGFVMGTTVLVGRDKGAQDEEGIARSVASSFGFFMPLGLVMTVVALLCAGGITSLMLTPAEAVAETNAYLQLCFWGVPFIVLYNVCASVFRGMGDSNRPLIFVGVACVVNIALDFALVGGLGLGAAGAALATVIGQACSAITALVVLLRSGGAMAPRSVKLHGRSLKQILAVGTPVAFQDGLIQVAFIVITVIANSRGLIASSSVGIVEKIIGFLFLVPSAFLAALSAFTAQNIGAGKPERARKGLAFALAVTVVYGLVMAIYCQFLPGTLVGLFTNDSAVYAAGCEYLRSYAWDAAFAAIHFCFSGYFCGSERSIVSFIHNLASIVLMRIPGAYLASIIFPDSLYPMGWAAPAGSLLSAAICVAVYAAIRRRELTGNVK